MQPIVTALITGIIAALLSGFLLFGLHHQLMPQRLSRVKAYTVGSASCLAFSSAAIFVTDYFSNLTAWGAVLILALVWGLSGAAVAFGYLGDKKAAQKRLNKHG